MALISNRVPGACISLFCGLFFSGGGRKAIFSDLYPGVKTYFKHERDCGRYVDKEDLVLEFESLLMTLRTRLATQKEVEGDLSMADNRRLEALAALLPKLSHIGF